LLASVSLHTSILQGWHNKCSPANSMMSRHQIARSGISALLK
jgi:hypothetical protein